MHLRIVLFCLQIICFRASQLRMVLVGWWNPVLGGAINARHLRANAVPSGVGVVIPPIIVVCQITLFNTCQYIYIYIYIFNGCNRLTAISNTGTGCQSGYGSCTGSGGGGGPTPPTGGGGGSGGRPRPGSVPYGQIISSCTQNGVVALTFDDGPYMFVNLFFFFSITRTLLLTITQLHVRPLGHIGQQRCQGYFLYQVCSATSDLKSPPQGERETNHVRSVVKTGVTQLQAPQIKPSSSE